MWPSINLLYQVLLHSLWQAAVVWAVVAIVSRGRTVRTRLAITQAAVFLWLLAQLCTWTMLSRSTRPSSTDSLHRSEALAGAVDPRVEAMIDRKLNVNGKVIHEPQESRPLFTQVAAVARASRVPSLVLCAAAMVWAAAYLVRARRVMRMIEASSTPLNPDLTEKFERFSGTIGIRRAVDFRATTSLAVPAAAGLLRSVVYIPALAPKVLSASILDAFVLHELGHIRHRDILIKIGFLVLLPLYLLNPFVWLLRRRIELDIESRCDEVATAVTGGDIVSYADALVTWAETPAAALMLGLGDGPVTRRVAQLKRDRNRLYQPASRLGVALATVMAACAMAASGVTVGEEVHAEELLQWASSQSIGTSVLEATGIRHHNPAMLDAFGDAITAIGDARTVPLDDPGVQRFIAVAQAGADGEEFATLLRAGTASRVRNLKGPRGQGVAGGDWKYGTQRSRYFLTRGLMDCTLDAAKPIAERRRLARASVVAAALDYSGASAVMVRRIAMEPELLRLLDLQPAQFEMLSVACSVEQARLNRTFRLMPTDDVPVTMNDTDLVSYLRLVQWSTGAQFLQLPQLQNTDAQVRHALDMMANEDPQSISRLGPIARAVNYRQRD
ncbi:MAG: M56 family metallopeptidase [Tepidisphaeraceae bacterium]